MREPPRVAPSNLPPANLVPIISKSLLVQVFLPYSEYSALQSLVAPQTGPPPWTRALEVWFHTVDPRFWEEVGKDELQDSAQQDIFTWELEEDRNELTSAQRRDLLGALEILRERRQVRFCTVWGASLPVVALAPLRSASGTAHYCCSVLMR